MTHPSSLVLESFAVGESLPADHASHVEQCAACAAFVAELRGLVAAGPSATEAEAAVARALATAGADHAPREAREASQSRSAPAEPKATPIAEAEVQRARRRRAWALATSVITPLAAAAAIVLLARSQPAAAPAPVDPIASQAAPSAPPDRLLVGTLPPRPEPDTQFKGGMQLAVVRERGALQERFSGTVHVRPGDRLRVEVALDQEQAILGAVVADDGGYVELMPEGTRGPGTHFSERSAKIDAAPTRGTILVGPAEAVARARATKQLAGVSTLRVEWEAP